jgi:hypothetical protein
MKPESLNALILDRELGELVPEAAELLEAWLAEHPEANAHGQSIPAAFEAARLGLDQLPQTTRAEAEAGFATAAFAPATVPVDKSARFSTREARIVEPHGGFRPLWGALAAAFVILVGGSGWIGYQTGRQSAEASSLLNPATPLLTQSSPGGGPWTRYVVRSDPRGGLTVAPRNSEP